MGSDNWAVGHEDLVGGPTHVPWAGGENKRGGKGGYGRLRKTGLIHNCWLQHCSLSGDSRGWKADFKLLNQRVQWRPLPSATDHAGHPCRAYQAGCHNYSLWLPTTVLCPGHTPTQLQIPSPLPSL